MWGKKRGKRGGGEVVGTERKRNQSQLKNNSWLIMIVESEPIYRSFFKVHYHVSFNYCTVMNSPKGSSTLFLRQCNRKSCALLRMS